jgi:acyl-CoA thioesterase-1
MIRKIILAMIFTATASFASEISPQLIAVFHSLEKGEKQTVVLYGTSLTIGGEWARAMKAWFDDAYPDQVTFVNSGKGGANSAFGVEKLEERVLSYRPDFVMIEFSYNDAIDDILTPGQAWQNLDQMVTRIQKKNPSIAIILQTMNVGWDPRPDHLPFSRRAKLEIFNENYRRYAREKSIPFIDNYPAWLQLKQQEPEKYRTFIPDGSHPTSEGSLAIHWPAVKTLLETARASSLSQSELKSE